VTADEGHEGEPVAGVSTIELFFDLVFVFTITQLTALVHEHPDASGLLRALLELCVVFWMYGGYAWLTNAVPPSSLRFRVGLLVGMGGFLLIALSIPEAFGDRGIGFGVGYLVVTVVHLVIYKQATDQDEVRAILRIAPLNLTVAGLVLAAGFVDGAADAVLFTLAVLGLVGPPVLGLLGAGFNVRPHHFVERHGLILLIALGESVVAVGIGASNADVDAGVVLAAIAGLAVTVGLWWCWFDGDDEAAEEALAAAPRDRRSLLALTAFGYAWVPILAGIVLTAAGIEAAVAHPTDADEPVFAWLVGAGIAAYLVGTALVQRILGIGRPRNRLVAAGAALAVAPVGLASPAGQLATSSALLAALAAWDRATSRSAATGSSRARPGG
jgi:low temperature requirement protein LtrA